MISDWPIAIDFVLRMEGGYTMDPNDPGGETKYGICRRDHPNLDIPNLTKEAAMGIYRRDFWHEIHGDELASPYAIALFDCAVNQGVTRAIRILQIALNVDVDGVIGPQTVAATFRATPNDLKRFLAQRQTAYIRTIMANRNLLVYAMNWSYRVIDLADLVFNLPPPARYDG